MKRVAFHDLPAQAFPMDVEFYRADTGEVVCHFTIDGPGVLEVPPLARELGTRVNVRVRSGDGHTYDSVRDETREDH